ncbi:MAG: hypothetical protein ACWA5P_07635 [bacterium]
MLKRLSIYLFILTSSTLIAQQELDFKEVYIDNNLIYKVSDDSLFTGMVKKMRKNGHIVYEEKYDKGIILYSNLYYNGKEKIISDKVIYHRNNPFKYDKKYKYNLKGETTQIIDYNENGEKILEEEFINGNLSYSCQFLNGKKHGMMLGYLNGGETLTYKCEYIDGKKHGTEYCLNEKGKEKIQQFHYGKKIH